LAGTEELRQLTLADASPLAQSHQFLLELHLGNEGVYVFRQARIGFELSVDPSHE